MADASSRTEHPFQGMALEDADRSLKTEDSQDSTEQSDAGHGWGPHPVNIRVTIPFPFGRWFFTLVGGPERRDPTRRAIERQKHPLFTLGNLFFLFVVGAVIGTAVAVLMINGAVQLLDGSYTVMTP
jgi:hypothetical protein